MAIGRVIKKSFDNSKEGYIGVFTNYTALITAFPSAIALDLAYVKESQGSAWLPGPLGGTFYSKGTYLFDGSNWVSALDEVSDELNNLISDKEALANKQDSLAVDGTGVKYPTVDAVNGRRMSTIAREESTSVNAVANDFVIMTTGATNKTVTLPASPLKDDIIDVAKADSGIGICVADGNGETINGETTAELNIKDMSLTFHYTGSEWRVK